MVEDYQEKINFLVLYVAEAHPLDLEATGSAKRSSKSSDEECRIKSAKSLIESASLKCSVAVDLVTNSAAKAYGVKFDRLYIIRNGIVYYQGGPGPVKYSIKELEKQLLELM